jgi:hypothetical protein
MLPFTPGNGGSTMRRIAACPLWRARVTRRPGGPPGEAELGYRLRQSVWGQGYDSEGACALIRQGFTAGCAAGGRRCADRQHRPPPGPEEGGLDAGAAVSCHRGGLLRGNRAGTDRMCAVEGGRGAAAHGGGGRRGRATNDPAHQRSQTSAPAPLHPPSRSVFASCGRRSRRAA